MKYLKEIRRDNEKWAIFYNPSENMCFMWKYIYKNIERGRELFKLDIERHF